MATQEILKYHIPTFWNDEFKKLDYINEQLMMQTAWSVGLL